MRPVRRAGLAHIRRVCGDHHDDRVRLVEHDVERPYEVGPTRISCFENDGESRGREGIEAGERGRGGIESWRFDSPTPERNLLHRRGTSPAPELERDLHVCAGRPRGRRRPACRRSSASRGPGPAAATAGPESRGVSWTDFWRYG